MDGQRFDEIAKRLAAGLTRRQAVRALGAGLVGGLFGWTRPWLAVADDDDDDDGDDDDGGGDDGEDDDDDGRRRCKPAAPARDSRCSKDSQCCAGLVCDGRRCRPGCRVRRAFYAPDQANPKNPCQRCRPDLSTAAFSQAPAATPCGSGPTCTGGTATAQATCDGAGRCTPGPTTACAPYLCGATACLTSCGTDVECADGSYCSAPKCVAKLDQGSPCGTGNQCSSGFCVAGACCAGEDYCNYEGFSGLGEVCCDPNRSPTATCCPAGDGRCCECFRCNDVVCLGGQHFCCDPAKICGPPGGDPGDDTCCHDDEDCVNGDCCWKEKHCAGSCCATRCCGGTCCGPWDDCSLASDGSEVCQPLKPCTFATGEAVCGQFDRCASPDGSGGSPVCCPIDRFIELPLAPEAPPADRFRCCPFGEGRGQGSAGNQFVCFPGPDFGGTFRGRATRP